MSVSVPNSPEQPDQPPVTYEELRSAPTLVDFAQVAPGESVTIRVDSQQYPGKLEQFTFVRSNAPPNEPGAPEFFWQRPLTGSSSDPNVLLGEPDLVPVQILGACLPNCRLTGPPYNAEAGVAKKDFLLLIGVIATIGIDVLDLDPTDVPTPRISHNMTMEEQKVARQQTAHLAWLRAEPNELITQLMIGPARDAQ